MDAQKASYSITLMANVLGVTRAGYYGLFRVECGWRHLGLLR